MANAMATLGAAVSLSRLWQRFAPGSIAPIRAALATLHGPRRALSGRATTEGTI